MSIINCPLSIGLIYVVLFPELFEFREGLLYAAAAVGGYHREKRVDKAHRRYKAVYEGHHIRLGEQGYIRVLGERRAFAVGDGDYLRA